jgi:hypothetical protein
MKPTFFKFVTDTYIGENSPAGDLAGDTYGSAGLARQL